MGLIEGGGTVPDDVLEAADGLPDNYYLVQFDGGFWVIEGDTYVFKDGEGGNASDMLGSGVQLVSGVSENGRMSLDEWKSRSTATTQSLGMADNQAGDLEQVGEGDDDSHDHGSSSGGGSDDEVEGADTSELNGVPPGGFIVQVGDGRAFWAKTVPGTQPPATVMWHIRDADDYDQMTNGRTFDTVTFDTIDEAEAQGYFEGGFVEEVLDNDEDPLDLMVADIQETLQYSPMFGDPEIMSLIAEARMEGRDVSDAELRSTDYWLSRTDNERAWDELAMSGLMKNGELPAEAKQQMDSNRLMVQRMLIERGWNGTPPQSLVNYLADQYTTGSLTEGQLQVAVEAEVDPFSPNASPFAGKQLGDDQYVVQDRDGTMYVRTRDGDYKLTGPGQEARYGEGARQILDAPPEGTHVKDAAGNHYFRDANGNLYAATGDGQIAGLERLYGDAMPMDDTVPNTFYSRREDGQEFYSRQGEDGEGGAEAPGMDVQGTVVDLFGGAGGIEQYGEINEVGTADQVLVDQSEAGNSALGEVERVRNLVLDWLGPVFGQWEQRQIEEWAGKLRQNPNTEDQLIDVLRGQRQALFPSYDENLRYVDIAAPWERMMNQYLGRGPTENDEFFTRVVNMNDPEEARKLLMKKGMAEGNQTTQSIVRQAAYGAFGGANTARSVL